MSQWVYKYSKFKKIVDVDKSSIKMLIKVIFIRPEAKWSNLEQAEKLIVILLEGPNQFVLKNVWMTGD